MFRTFSRVFLGLALLLAFVPAAAAAWLESGAPAPTPTPWWAPPTPDYYPTPFPTPWPTPHRWIQPPPPPRMGGPEAAVRDFLDGASLGTPYGYGGLTIVPVIVPSRVTTPNVRSLDDALRAGTLRVSDSGSVPTVLIDNRGSTPVFLMAGEIIIGGKQDRVIREDVVIGARSGPVEVAVYCVEQGRWAPSAKAFESAPYAADAGLRSQAAAGAPQSEVWSHVARKSESAGVSSSTQAYDDYVRDPQVSRRIDEYVRSCPRPSPWRGRAAGAIFLYDGQVIGVDLFADSGLLSSLWPKLVRSYAAQVMDHGGSRTWQRHDSGNAQSVLSALQSAWPSFTGWSGSGARVTIAAAGFQAWGLTLDDRVVHIAALPGYTYIEPPYYQPVPPPDPWYRYPGE